MKAREGAALVAEQEALLAEYEKIVAKARKKAAGSGKLSPLEHWRETVKEAEEPVSAVKCNLTDDERREVLADDLERRRADPLLYRAAVNPDAPAPSPTMLDAKEMYRKERMNGAEGRNHKNPPRPCMPPCRGCPGTAQ